MSNGGGIDVQPEPHAAAAKTGWAPRTARLERTGRAGRRVSFGNIELGFLPAPTSSNPGDVRSLGGGLMEIRIDYGSGYRVYFAYEGTAVVILLCGGDERRQHRDVEQARSLLERHRA
jgi:hypothetical protein